ncbi:hypothetical protein KSP39_PZI010037 [Platanthera zijinensis]|uniref:Uncharacterized protein n=1 Tax=Platanthera zijinensis TaxID=2320716 RepID=A0AAP0BI19_9ASPA
MAGLAGNQDPAHDTLALGRGETGRPALSPQAASPRGETGRPALSPQAARPGGLPSRHPGSHQLAWQVDPPGGGGKILIFPGPLRGVGAARWPTPPRLLGARWDGETGWKPGSRPRHPSLGQGRDRAASPRGETRRPALSPQAASPRGETGRPARSPQAASPRGETGRPALSPQAASPRGENGRPALSPQESIPGRVHLLTSLWTVILPVCPPGWKLPLYPAVWKFAISLRYICLMGILVILTTGLGKSINRPLRVPWRALLLSHLNPLGFLPPRHLAQALAREGETSKQDLMNSIGIGPNSNSVGMPSVQSIPLSQADVEMADGGNSHGEAVSNSLLKPVGGIGKKKLKKLMQMKKLNRRSRKGKGWTKRSRKL